MNELFTWLAIVLCLSQSATFSGLNLAVFSLSRLQLESAAADGSEQARRVLALRQDANYTLATILWGNVGVNVLLTLLADSVLAGLAAFFFSTVVITIAAEIVPQAWFSRNALPVASRLAPFLRFYKWVLWPVAKPSGLVLDAWVGPEGVPWLREHELRQMLEQHARGSGHDIDAIEAIGAINFLALDDVPVGEEGALLDPASVITLEFTGNRPVFPSLAGGVGNPFIRQVLNSGRKWVVFVDASDQPRLVASAPALLRAALLDFSEGECVSLCHRPLVVRDASLPLGRVLTSLRARHPDDGVIDEDLILVWSDPRRIITGADLLGRLLHRIARPAA